MPPGTTAREMNVEGQIRRYRLHIPSGYHADKPVSLVINLHGLGTNPIFEDLLSGMSLQAEREGFIIVYPEAQNSAWNAAAGNKTKEDLDFISVLVQSLQSRYSIDPKRIYATGISNGGGMANRIACTSGRCSTSR